MNQDKDLSFVGHLDELRGRLVKVIVAIIVASCFFYLFVDHILVLITQPVGKLVFISPADAFLARIHLSIFGGLFLSLPVTLYQIWAFVAAGLKKNEAKYVMLFGPLSLVCFCLGSAFGYFVMIPIAIKFLLSFSSTIVVPMITIKSYISFVGMLLLAFGVIFELPLVLLFLTKIGIATPAFLIQKRKYAIVLILIVSALITPPDVITQLIMSGPLIILYEIGIIASKLTDRDRN